MIDLTQIVIAIIGLLVATVTTVLLPKIEIWINSKTTKEQQNIIISIAKTAVNAAQQLFSTEHAEEKKKYAIKIVMDELSRLNITIDKDAIYDYIEGVLKEIKITSGENW